MESFWNIRVPEILLGIAMLLFGKRLFWLFVGTAGFIVGTHLATLLPYSRPGWVTLAIAVAAGVLGAFFAIFLQRLAIAFGGFALGGYVLPRILAALGVGAGYSYWVLFLAGGIAGLFFVAVLFNWTLIVLSSISGAILILQPFHAGMHAKRLLLVLAIAIGIAAQTGLMRDDGKGR
jgi:hypothetical protein